MMDSDDDGCKKPCTVTDVDSNDYEVKYVDISGKYGVEDVGEGTVTVREHEGLVKLSASSDSAGLECEGSVMLKSCVQSDQTEFGQVESSFVLKSYVDAYRVRQCQVHV